VRTANRIVLMFLLISTLSSAFIIQRVRAEPRTLIVDDDGPADYHTIQEAIDNSYEGDTIFVRSGLYSEHISVPWAVDLRICGEDRSSTIIDGNWSGAIVTILGGSNVTFAHFTVRNAGWTSWEDDNGIRLKWSNSTLVTDCTVTGCAFGIREWSEFWAPHGAMIGHWNVISGNTVSDCSQIAIGSTHDSSLDHVIANNTITNSSNQGIYFNNPYNMQIIGNHVLGTESQSIPCGIHLQVGPEGGGSNNTITGNSIEYCENGIGLDYADNNVVKENTVENCSCGVYLGSGSSGNIVYHNNFIGNAFVSDAGSNFWDNGCEGNYWSDYAGTDLDKDGVGDTELPWSGVDYYPLMNRYWNGADINHDLKVDVKDVYAVGRAYGTSATGPNPEGREWNPHCDINEDDKIDIKDYYPVCKNYGKTYY